MPFNYFSTHEFPHTTNYDSDLREVLHYMKEFETALNEYAQAIEDLQDAADDVRKLRADVTVLQNATKDLPQIRSQIKSLQATTNLIISRLTDAESDIDALFEGFREQTALVNKLINDARLEMLEQIMGVETEVFTRIYVLNAKVERYYDELLHRIEELVPTDVYNRVAGERLSLDDNNFNVYEDLRYGGLTNAELAEYGQSNNYIASIVMNNRDQAINLRKRLKLHYLYSPTSGKRVSHANAISQAIVAFTNNAHSGATNNDLYSTMLADAATNDDIGSYYTSNYNKYFFMANV